MTVHEVHVFSVKSQNCFAWFGHFRWGCFITSNLCSLFQKRMNFQSITEVRCHKSDSKRNWSAETCFHYLFITPNIESYSNITHCINCLWKWHAVFPVSMVPSAKPIFEGGAMFRSFKTPNLVSVFGRIYMRKWDKYCVKTLFLSCR